ncbi:MAG: deoxyribonuclease IV, partial [Thermomicrobiales bacterium]|nr:deoxyribonuclease IV [Thermomicrobiales bacterium]
DKAIDRAEPLEITSIQIFTKNANQWAAKPLDPAVVDRFREKVAASPIKTVVAHDSYLINIASPDEAAWEKSLNALKIELDRCDILGVHHLVSHPGAHSGSGVEAGIDRVAAAVNRIHAEMPDGKATLAIETTAGQGTTLGRSFEEIAEMIDKIEDKARVTVCLDTCHVFAAGYDLRTPEEYAKTIKHFDDVIGLAFLSVIHLNDSLKPFASHRDRHAHIGQGELGLESFRHVMNDPLLDGLPGILETEKGDDITLDAMNLATLRSLVAV